MSEILGTLFKYLVSLLGVAAVVLVLYQVFGANKTQNAISDATLLQTNTQALYNGQNSFATVTNTVATNGKLAPPGMLTGTATTLANPWGGDVTIAFNGTTAAKFDITEAGVPIDACAKMIAGLSSVVGLSINGTVIAPATLPMDSGTAVTSCATGAAAGLATLIFTFGH
jgi:type II secretory pathway pseudopilin PulG